MGLCCSKPTSVKTYLKEYTKLEDHSPEIPPWIRDLFDK